MIDAGNLSNEDQFEADSLEEELRRILHDRRPRIVARALALIIYEAAADWRRDALRAALRPTASNVVLLREPGEVVPTAAGIEELLAAIGAETRSLRAFCAEINGEDGEGLEEPEKEDEEAWEEAP
jgi:hypothetical protein